MDTIAKHGGDTFEVSEKIGLPPECIIDFSSSVNPYGPPPRVLDSIKSSLQHIKSYPNRPYQRLREGIANYAGVEPEEVILGCGSAELIHSITMRFVRGSMVLPLPTFSEFEAAAAALGLEVRPVEPCDLSLNLDGAIEAIQRERAGCVVICNPNNPTGEVLETKKILELVETAADARTFVIVDEAYYELSEGAETLANLAGEFSNLFVLRSLTKPFGFPGLRVGYGVCNPGLAKKFEATAISWRVGILEEVAALSALEEKDFLINSKKMIAYEKNNLYEGIKSINGLVPLPSRANFFMVDVNRSGFSPKSLRWKLLSYGVLVRDLSSVKGLRGSYIRLSVRQGHENEVLLDALRNLTSSMGKLFPNNPVCAERRCHSGWVEDCRLCFCPFYPCFDITTGGKFVEREAGGYVWSCKDCSWVHRKDVADRVLQELSGFDMCSVDPEKLLEVRRRVLGELHP
ncbi:MAG: aminotransferase class I/II-fold pyridoxal phosphate-dependent enzyme [Candidatus Methanomethylicia archaeon]|nr:aminotransferase class I/II-fold pyridoxal phosphate-dependent enzyme [Candidatus Methanomethylicia archaeon]